MDDITIYPCLRYWFFKSSIKIVLIVVLFSFHQFFIQQNIYIKYGAGILIIILLVFALCDLIIIKKTKYIVSSEQIIIINGVFLKTTNYIELYRVFDYKHEQNLFDQILNLMTVKILSRDLSHPSLVMKGIPNNLRLIREIRNRVEIQKNIKKEHEINY